MTLALSIFLAFVVGFYLGLSVAALANACRDDDDLDDDQIETIAHNHTI